MGLRFRKSLKLLPGVRLNLSGSGASVSLGGRGFHYNMGPKGTRVTVGIPGTGLSWSEYQPYARRRRETAPSAIPPFYNPPHQQIASNPLTPISSAPAEQIAAKSTSELAVLLNDAQHRTKLAPMVLISTIGLCTLAYSLERPLEVSALIGVLAWPLAILVDKYRRSLAVDFRITESTAAPFSSLVDAFKEMSSSRGFWHIPAKGDTLDRKRNAGANTLLERKAISPGLSRPDCIRSDAAFPVLDGGFEKIYCLPDAVLIVTKSKVVALAYNDISIRAENVRFIEEGNAPADTLVIGNTWRFVNKDGGPDRRFSGNRQFPVCLYGELHLTSAGGLNELFQCSKHDTSTRFLEAFEVIRSVSANTQNTDLQQVASAYVKPASTWPMACMWLLVTVFAANALYITAGRALINKSESRLTRVPEAPANSASPPAVSINYVKPVEPKDSYQAGPSRHSTAPPTQVSEAIPLPRPRPKDLGRTNQGMPLSLSPAASR